MSARVAGALLIFLALAVIEVAFPTAFVPIVLVAFVVAPAINWRAWFRLYSKLGEPDGDEALRTNVNGLLFLAIGSSVTAGMGIFVAGQLLNIIPTIPRGVIVLGLAFPPIIATGPAFDWLLTIRRLERS